MCFGPFTEENTGLICNIKSTHGDNIKPVHVAFLIPLSLSVLSYTQSCSHLFRFKYRHTTWINFGQKYFTQMRFINIVRKSWFRIQKRIVRWEQSSKFALKYKSACHTQCTNFFFFGIKLSSQNTCTHKLFRLISTMQWSASNEQ